jgi:hypothetical protein
LTGIWMALKPSRNAVQIADWTDTPSRRHRARRRFVWSGVSCQGVGMIPTVHRKGGRELGLGQPSCSGGFRPVDDGQRDRPAALRGEPGNAGGTDLGVDSQERMALLGLVERFAQPVGGQVTADLHRHDHVVRLAEGRDAACGGPPAGAARAALYRHHARLRVLALARARRRARPLRRAPRRVPPRRPRDAAPSGGSRSPRARATRLSWRGSPRPRHGNGSSSSDPRRSSASSARRPAAWRRSRCGRTWWTTRRDPTAGRAAAAYSRRQPLAAGGPLNDAARPAERAQQTGAPWRRPRA